MKVRVLETRRLGCAAVAAVAAFAVACGPHPQGKEGKIEDLYADPEADGESTPLSSASLTVEKIETELPVQVDEYKIGPNDILNIVVLEHEELSSIRDFNKGIVGTVVKKDGFIYVPIIGKVQAAGYTVQEFQEVLQEHLRKFVVDPQLSVDILKYESQKFYVLGFVKEPGAFPVNGNTRLLEAIGLTKGVLPEGAIDRGYFVRGRSLLPIDLADLLLRGDTSRNVYMQDGDLVYIPSGKDQKVYVLGEVVRPGAVPLDNGRLSLAQAIAEVGGILPVEARKRSIKLIRGSWQEPTVYTLKYDTILETGDQIILRAGDRIVVAPTGLTQLSRYMQQILPLLTGGDTSLDIAGKSKALAE